MNTPLTSDYLTKYVPSLYAESAYPGASSRYNFMSTASVMHGLSYAGILPYAAHQAKTRTAGKAGYVKHTVRFRSPNAPLIVGDTVPEIVLTNSHDRASSFSLELGLFRLVCSNGLVTSSASFQSYKIRHIFSSADDVIGAVHAIIEQFPKLETTVGAWSGVTLSLDQQHVFAEQAMGLRWGKDKSPFSYDRLLSTRRQEDVAPTLWTVYNRVQENLLKGMPSDRHAPGSRAVTGLDAGLSINRQLWALAESFA